MTGVYIAGPMRGIDGFNFAAFERADEVVRDFFWEPVLSTTDGTVVPLEVFNPAWADIVRHGLQRMASMSGWVSAGRYLEDEPDFNLRQALAEDTQFISLKADHIVLLPGWERSAGVKAEKALSEALGHSVWYLDPDSDLIVAEDPALVAPEPVPALRPECQRLVDQILQPGPTDGASYVVYHETGEVGPGDETLGASEVRTKSSTGGEKGVKLARYDLIPVGPLRMLAEHYGRGAAKYADNQWRQGYEFSKSIAAKSRHFEDWRGADGHDYDVCPEDGYGCRHTDLDGNPFVGIPSEHGKTCFNHTGSHHLVADIWHSMFLLEGTEYWPEHDDRFVYGERHSNEGTPE